MTSITLISELNKGKVKYRIGIATDTTVHNLHKGKELVQKHSYMKAV
jgi:hypothetical protein